jgi:NTP pyrophosphatase (non-canonical NTP hydrolase)
MTDTRTSDTDAIQDQELNEELADVLTAISVITKRLAKKINVKGEEKECTNSTD